jgi:hypothetical protein
LKALIFAAAGLGAAGAGWLIKTGAERMKKSNLSGALWLIGWVLILAGVFVAGSMNPFGVSRP